MVYSIRVAHLLAYCVLIGSLAELLFSFCRWSVLAFLQMFDAITGKVMSSIVILLALKVHCNTYLFHGFIPRTRSCSGLLSLLYSTAPGSDQNLQMTASLLDSTTSGSEENLLLSMYLRSSAPPWLSTFGRSHLKYSTTVESAFLSKDTSWVCLQEERLGVRCYDYGLTGPLH